MSHCFKRSDLNVGLHKLVSMMVNDPTEIFSYVINPPNNNYYRLILCTKCYKPEFYSKMYE
jgi:predicted nucleic-acid-binding Zn-ribbon protein